MTTQSQPTAAGEAAHTPTPWQVYHLPKGYATGDGQLEIQGGEEMMTLVAFIPTERDAPRGMKQRKANAAFIVRACNSHAALVEALKMQDTDIPYSRKLEWAYRGLKAAGGDMPALSEIRALEKKDALLQLVKWAKEAAESERARVGANPDADTFVPSWLPELEAAISTIETK